MGERFDRLKQAFSSKPIEFRQSSFEAFAALSADDQECAIAAAAEYRRSCEAEKRKSVFLARFIDERVFEGFAKPNGAGPPATRVFVRRDTEPWRAWQRVKPSPCTYSTDHRADGWWFPSEWPPADTERRYSAFTSAAE